MFSMHGFRLNDKEHGQWASVHSISRSSSKLPDRVGGMVLGMKGEGQSDTDLRKIFSVYEGRKGESY